ncbi:MAG: hypothetical protein GXO77_03955 [Calditrichaeota bacterium]|nr:hypothetical protein [Calditrichota bacterium]
MKELNPFSAEEIKALKKHLESCCGVKIPEDTTRFGEIRFYLYSGSKSDEFHIQIFWGPHKIFSKRHFYPKSGESLLNTIQSIILKNSGAIKEELFEYCEERLNDFAYIELEPLIERHKLTFLNIDLKVCKARKKIHPSQSGGWPLWCVVMSWKDEFGEFQEFVRPLKFNSQTQIFEINGESIIKEFLKFRDQLI